MAFFKHTMFGEKWCIQTNALDSRGGGGCITESGKLNECNVSKHIMPQRLKHRVDGRRREGGRGQESFCFISARCVLFVCLPTADGVLTSAQPGYTNLPEQLALQAITGPHAHAQRWIPVCMEQKTGIHTQEHPLGLQPRPHR